MGVLPFASQINHTPLTPASNHALKAKVIFCVRGAISPLLANVYLHYVFDLWAERWRHREAVGNVIIVRYADDLIIGFELDKDVRCFREAMCDRLRSSR